MYVYCVECFAHVEFYCDSVCVCGMGWLKPVATVLLMCSAVFVECLVMNTCCVVMCSMFCVIYGGITISSVFATTDRRDISLYDDPMLMSLLDLGTGMMLHVGQFTNLWYFVVVECGVVYVREVF